MIRLAGIDPKNPTFIEDHLVNHVGIPRANIQSLKEDGRFYFFLDGYDEMPSQPLINLYQSGRLREWKHAKVVIGCRSQHLARVHSVDDYFAPYVGEGPQVALLEKWYISPFHEGQREEYLSKYFTQNPIEGWSAKHLLDVIDKNPDIKEMTKTPFILSMAAVSLPALLGQSPSADKLELKRSELYDAFVETWFQRQQTKLLPASAGLTLKTVQRYCEQLATEMEARHCHEVVYAPQKSLFSNVGSPPWDKFFRWGDERLELIRRCAPLQSTQAGFAFLHRSIFDHFVVRAEVQKIRGVSDLAEEKRADTPQNLEWELVQREAEQPYSSLDIPSTQALVERWQEALSPHERGLLKTLALDTIVACRLPADPSVIQELVCLAGTKDPTIMRAVLEAICSPIKDEVTLPLSMIEGLTSAVSYMQVDGESTTAEDHSNLLFCMGLLFQRLGSHHQNEAEEALFKKLNALSCLVDAFLDGGIVAQGSDVRAWLESIQRIETSHPQVKAQRQYCREGLLRLENTDTNLSVFLQRAGLIVGGVSAIMEGISSYSPLRVYQGLKDFREAARTRGRTHSWYDEVRMATLFLRCPPEGGISLEHIETYKQWRTELIQEEPGFFDGFFDIRAAQRGVLRDETAFALLEALDHQIQKKQSDHIRATLLEECAWLAENTNPVVQEAMRHLFINYARYDDLGEQSALHIAAVQSQLGPAPASFSFYNYHTRAQTASHQLLTAAKQSGSWLLAQSGVEMMNDPTVLEERSYHVPLYLSSSKGESGSPLAEVFHTFLSHPTQWVLLLLGNSGSGKSLSTKLEAAERWSQRLQSEFDTREPVPLFISLTGVSRHSTTLVEERLAELGFQEEKIQEMKSQTFTFYLDGYDEMKGDELTNLIQQNSFVGLEEKVGWRGKIIISCRSQFAEQVENYPSLFTPSTLDSENEETFKEVCTVPFRTEQIEQYLTQFSAQVRMWTPADYMRYIETLPGVRSLIKTPFMLRLLAEVLPNIVAQHREAGESTLALTRSDCYSAFVDLWFERQHDKLIRAGHSDLSYHEVGAYREYAEQLAKEMGTSTEVSYTPPDREDPFASSEDLDSFPARYFSMACAPLLIRARTACPLRVRRHGDTLTFSFIHDTVREFLACRQSFNSTPINAAQFLARLEEKSIPHHEEAREETKRSEEPSLSLEERDIQAIQEGFGRVLLSKQLERIRFYVDSVQQEAGFKEKLLALLEVAKNKPELAIASSNALTVLVAAGHSFEGADLEGLFLRGALLDGGNFSGANLRNTHLTGASMQGVCLFGADARGADMKDVQWGQDPAYMGTWAERLIAVSDKIAAISGGKVHIWEAGATQPKELIIDGEINQAQDLSSSQDGRLLAVAYGPPYEKRSLCKGIIKIWDWASESLLHNLKGHKGTVNAIALSAEGTHLVSGSDDTTVRIWPLVEGGRRHAPLILEGHSNKVLSVAYSPDGTKVASTDGDVHVWDPHTGTPLIQILDTGSHIVRFSPDNQHIALAGNEQIHIWKTEGKGRKVTTLEGHNTPIQSIAYSPDGQRIVSGAKCNTLRVWDAIYGGENLLKIPTYVSGTNAVAYTPDGSQIISGGDERMIRLWKSGRQAFITSLVSEQTRSIDSLQYSGDGSQLAVGSYDGTVSIWDTFTQKRIHHIKAFTNQVSTVAFSPDKQRIAAGGYNTSHVRIIQLADEGEEPIVLKEEIRAYSLVFSPDSTRLAGAGRSKIVYIWDAVRAGEAIVSLEGHQAHIKALVFSPNSERIASGSEDKTIRVWDVARAQLLFSLQTRYSVTSLSYSHDGKRLASSGDELYVFDAEKEADPLLHLSPGGYESQGIAFSPDDKHIAVARGSEGVVQIWDSVLGGAPLSSFGGGRVASGMINGIDYSPDGAYLAVGNRDSSMRVWSLHDGQRAPTVSWRTDRLSLAKDLQVQEVQGLSPSGKLFFRQLEVAGLEKVSEKRHKRVRFSDQSEEASSASTPSISQSCCVVS